MNIPEDRGSYSLKPVFLLLYIHGKSTVVTIISKIRGIGIFNKKCTEFSPVHEVTLSLISTSGTAHPHVLSPRGGGDEKQVINLEWP